MRVNVNFPQSLQNSFFKNVLLVIYKVYIFNSLPGLSMY